MRLNDVASARTLLFVPGHRPDRFAKAAAAGADGVVLDLEDAVAAEDKDTAREHVRTWLAEGNQAVVRVNAADTEHHDADLAALGGLATVVMLPKAEHARDVTAAAAVLGSGTGVVPLIETADGVLRAREICAAPAAVRPAFGSIDLAAQLGVDPDSHTALATARSTLVLAAAGAGCAPPLDGVTAAIGDEARLVADTEHAVALGFTGKLCVHPRQVAAVHAALEPSADELRWARGVLAVATTDGAVGVFESTMVDRPVVLRAERLLSRAGLSGAPA
ncbi:HpcH/HpaI aldolase/citrate lyase family protein [Prauserella cavernicola]|uniref:CoA ester lyase n=1 Tax=Prauserella cavernicola TaxID=2800127 RepID=A0A934V8M5_9PSEU|nr:CoA ester lyase [Prauserella cavernicola]MBK1788455.1 CoA ester lyase [Prauserella cavernicola]